MYAKAKKKNAFPHAEQHRVPLKSSVSSIKNTSESWTADQSAPFSHDFILNMHDLLYSSLITKRRWHSRHDLTATPEAVTRCHIQSK
jgi:hypothetical protein